MIQNLFLFVPVTRLGIRLASIAQLSTTTLQTTWHSHRPPVRSLHSGRTLYNSNPTRTTEMSVEAAKALAGAAAVNNHVTADTAVVGVGSGSTIVYAVQRLAERVREEGLKIRLVKLL